MERGNMQLTLPIDFPIFLERTNGNHIIYIIVYTMGHSILYIYILKHPKILDNREVSTPRGQGAICSAAGWKWLVLHKFGCGI